MKKMNDILFISNNSTSYRDEFTE